MTELLKQAIAQARQKPPEVQDSIAALILRELKDEADVDDPMDTALVSEPALSKDWNRADEDEAWQHLQ